MFRNLRARTAPAQPVTKPMTRSSPNDTDTVLGANATLEGTLTTEGNVRISGSFDGDITTRGNIHVTESGKVEGNVKGNVVAIGGVVRGDVDARRISVQHTGRVWGDLTTHALTTEEGGFIQGVITMQSQEIDDREVEEMLSDLEAQVAEVVDNTSKE